MNAPAFANYTPEFKKACEGVDHSSKKEGFADAIRTSFLEISWNDDLLNKITCIEFGVVENISDQDLKTLEIQIKESYLKDLQKVKKEESEWQSFLDSATYKLDTLKLKSNVDKTSEEYELAEMDVQYHKDKVSRMADEYEHIENVYSILDYF